MDDPTTSSTIGDRLRQDVEQTRADLERGVEALRRDLEQTKAHLSGGQRGEDLNQTAGDTLLQAFGREPIPEDGGANPVPEVVPLDPEAALPRCGACDALLVNEEACWVCPNGHGHAATYSVSTRLIGPVAVRAVQSAAAEAAAAIDGAEGVEDTDLVGGSCPFCGRSMVRVDLWWDETSTSALLHPGGPEQGRAVLEACTIDRLIWFDRESADAIPRA